MASPRSTGCCVAIASSGLKDMFAYVVYGIIRTCTQALVPKGTTSQSSHSFGSGLTWHYIIFAIKQSLLHGSRSFTGAYRRPQPRPRRLHPDPACGGPLMAASPHSHRFAGSQTKTTPSTSWISPLRSTPCFAGPPRLGHFHPTCNVTGAITAPRPQHTGGFRAGFGLKWAALKDVDLLFPAMSPSCRRLISSRRHTRAEGRGHRERECVGETHKHTRGPGGGVTDRENVWVRHTNTHEGRGEGPQRKREREREEHEGSHSVLPHASSGCQSFISIVLWCGFRPRTAPCH